MDNDPREWDVSLLSYDEFVQFFFKRPAEERTGDPLQDCVHFDFGHGPLFNEVQFPETVVEHLTKLFSSFHEIASHFSLRQINQGLWKIWGCDFELHKTFGVLPWKSQRELNVFSLCIFVYANFVAKSQVRVMENCFDMWWDFICTDFWFGSKQEGDVEKLSDDARQVLEAIWSESCD